ncbi:MAG TPA: hypothetical protein PLO62_00150 [Candidatus Hydrogenedentes bacterium]|mgnify:FL=1|nr:hypothetical protein [Candidatus Hydrogenedentota bacterium]HOS01865.1 hypothetical protein [Candidatus Hydrogenedentota bacterium]
MNKPTCPGPYRKDWHPEDIFLVTCPECGVAVEFWKDDASQRCPQCKATVSNPRGQRP